MYNFVHFFNAIASYLNIVSFLIFLLLLDLLVKSLYYGGKNGFADTCAFSLIYKKSLFTKKAGLYKTNRFNGVTELYTFFLLYLIRHGSLIPFEIVVLCRVFIFHW